MPEPGPVSLDREIEAALLRADAPTEELIRLGLEASAMIVVSEDMASGTLDNPSADPAVRSVVQSAARSEAARLRALLPQLQARCGQCTATPEVLVHVAPWLLAAFVRRINSGREGHPGYVNVQ